jgi:hypothetical protein
VGGSFLGDVRSRDKEGGGNRRGATTTAGSWRLCVVSVVIGNRVARGTGQPSQAVKMETGRRQVGLAQQNIFSNFQTPLKLQIQKGSVPLFKKYSLFACGYV